MRSMYATYLKKPKFLEYGSCFAQNFDISYFLLNLV